MYPPPKVFTTPKYPPSQKLKKPHGPSPWIFIYEKRPLKSRLIMGLIGREIGFVKGRMFLTQIMFAYMCAVVCLFILLSVCHSPLCLSVNLSIYLSVCYFVLQCVCLSIYLSVCQFVLQCVCFCTFVLLSVCQSV